MRSMMMMAAMMVMVGCATDGDDTVVTTFPDHVEGTFTRGGESVDFEASATQIIVKSEDGQTILEATLTDGVPKTKVDTHAPAVEALREAFELGTIECPAPLLPRFWYSVDSYDASTAER